MHPTIERARKREFREKIAITGALCPRLAQPLVPFFSKGSSNSQQFVDFCTNTLLPLLTPGDVLVLDNASFHTSKETTTQLRAILDPLFVELLFLPPYSPQLNPIEQAWRFLKKKLKAVPSTEDINSICRSILQSIDQEIAISFLRRSGW